MVATIVLTLLGGALIGVLGKYVAPGGRDNIPWWLTVLCGVAGMLAGSWLYAALFTCRDLADCGPGVDWWRHAWQVGVATILVVVAATLTARRTPSR